MCYNKQMMMICLCMTVILRVHSSYFYKNGSLQISNSVTSMVLSSNNQLLLTATFNNSAASSNSTTSNLRIYLLDVKSVNHTYELVQTVNMGIGLINFLQLSRDSNILVAGVQNKNLKMYTVSLDGKLTYAVGTEGWDMGENQIDISLDTYYLAMGCSNSTISIFERNLTTADNNTNDSSLLTSQQNSVPSLKYTKTQTILPTNSGISSLKISPNSSILYVAYTNYSLCAYNLNDSGYTFSTMLRFADDIITVIHLSDQGKVMVTGSKKGIVRVLVSDSRGNGLYLSQALIQGNEEITRIRVTNNNLLMLVTNMKGQTSIYTRIDENYNWLYDEDKSKILLINKKGWLNVIASQINSKKDSPSNLVSPMESSSSSLVVYPFLSPDDNILLHSSSPIAISILVSCGSTHHHCDNCQNNSICVSCLQYFYLNQSECKRCPTGCILCRSQRVCYRCASSNYLDSLQAICFPCNTEIPNCRECDGPKLCTKCVDGYSLTGNDCELVEQLDSSPNVIIHVNDMSMKTKSEEIIIDNPRPQIHQGSDLLSVFVIVCVVFLVLLVITGVLLYYVTRILKNQKSRSEETVNFNNQIPISERRIVSQTYL